MWSFSLFSYCSIVGFDPLPFGSLMHIILTKRKRFALLDCRAKGVWVTDLLGWENGLTTHGPLTGIYWHASWSIRLSINVTFHAKTSQKHDVFRVRMQVGQMLLQYSCRCATAEALWTCCTATPSSAASETTNVARCVVVAQRCGQASSTSCCTSAWMPWGATRGASTSQGPRWAAGTGELPAAFWRSNDKKAGPGVEKPGWRIMLRIELIDINH